MQNSYGMGSGAIYLTRHVNFYRACDPNKILVVFLAARCRISVKNKNSGRRTKSAKRKKVAPSDFTAK